MAVQVTLDELLTRVGLDKEYLEQECSDDHAKHIATFFEWRKLAPNLGFTETDISDIENEKKTEHEKRLQYLMTWKEMSAFKATYLVLVETLLTHRKAGTVQKICQLLKDEQLRSCNGDVGGAGLNPNGRSTSELAPSLSMELVQDCGCQKCNIYELATRSHNCKAPSVSRVCILRGKKLGWFEENDLVPKTEKIKRHHRRLVFMAFGSYQKLHDTAYIVDFLRRLDNSMYEKAITKMEGITDMEEIFYNILKPYWSWWNNELLEDLIKIVKDDHLTKELEQYNEEVKKFLNSRLRRLSANIVFGQDEHLDTTSIMIVKVDKEWREITLLELRRLKTALADILSCDPMLLYLCSATEGCIFLKFRVAECVTEAISVLRHDQIASLNDNNVFFLRCDGKELSIATDAENDQISHILTSQSGESLHYWCRKGQTRMVMFLLEQGADVTSEDHDGNTCLHLIQALKNPNLIEVLTEAFLQSSVSLELPNKNGVTPLVCCCQGGEQYLESAQILITSGAQVNGSPNGGVTPLVAAVRSGVLEMVEMLIQKGVDVNASAHVINEVTQSEIEETPLAAANNYGFQDIAEVLLRSGANGNCICWPTQTSTEVGEIPKMIFTTDADFRNLPADLEATMIQLFKKLSTIGTDQKDQKKYPDSGKNIMEYDPSLLSGTNFTVVIANPTSVYSKCVTRQLAKYTASTVTELLQEPGIFSNNEVQMMDKELQDTVLIYTKNGLKENDMSSLSLLSSQLPSTDIDMNYYEFQKNSTDFLSERMYSYLVRKSMFSSRINGVLSFCKQVQHTTDFSKVCESPIQKNGYKLYRVVSRALSVVLECQSSQGYIDDQDDNPFPLKDATHHLPEFENAYVELLHVYSAYALYMHCIRVDY